MLICAMTGTGTIGRRQEPDALIVTHRFKVDPGRTGQLSDGDASRFCEHSTIEPVVPTGAILAEVEQEH